MTPQWRHKWRHVKNTKITKNRQIMVFRYFFKQKLHFLAMMCVKVCLHMFLLQINQINKIKHSASVSWNKKTTKNTICVQFPLKISFWSVFRWTQRSITQRRVITPGPIFLKMVLKWAQGLKEKSHEVSARKNNNRLRYNKKCRGFRPPALLGLRLEIYENKSRFIKEYPVNYTIKLLIFTF